MKKSRFSDSTVGRIFSGKGFYVALCVALLAIGGSGFLAYNQAVNELNNIPNIAYTNETTQANEVIHPQTDIPKETTTAQTTEAKPTETEQVTDTAIIMVMPVTGEILTPFSYGELVKSNTTNIWQTHNGVDILADFGSEVKAMAQGIVTEVGLDPLWGNYVVIEHDNNLVSKYTNLAETVPVTVGESVSAGTIVGSIGDSAEVEIADPSHLHFEVTQNGEYINPIDIISPNSK